MIERIGFTFSDRPHMRDYARLAQMAEALGYDSIWISEPRMARDAITGMAVVAQATKRIRIASSVVDMWRRGPGLMAVTYKCLDMLAPDRIILGLGTYWDPLASNQGITRSKLLTAMREYVDIVRRLWKLERVTFEGEVIKVRSLELDEAHAEQLAYGNIYGSGPINIPIYLGATGEKMLQLSGEIADGVLLNAAFSPDYVRYAVQQVKIGADRVGRPLSSIDLPKMIYVAVDRGRDSWPAVKRKITRYLGQQPHVQKYSGLSDDKIHEIEDAIGSWPPRPGGIEAAMRIVPDEIVRSLIVFGTPVECKDQIRRFIEAGASWPVLMTENDDVEDVLSEFAPQTWN